ncbi:MAG: branched-chain amino acid ABC transporter permease, partial [Desulfocapsaceae bacterium]
MTSGARKSVIVTAGALFFCLLPWAAHYFGEQYLVSLFTRILIYSLAAVSLDLLIGYGGLVSLGHAAFVGIGGYVTAIFFHHSFEGEPLAGIFAGSENALLVWPLAIIISAGFALVIGGLSLRTSGMHFIMITLAFAQMLYYFAVGLEKYGGDDGLSLFSRNQLVGVDLGNDVHFYYVCLFFLALFLFIIDRLVKSRFGLVLRGAASNSRRVKALGIPDRRYKLICFVIGGAGA